MKTFQDQIGNTLTFENSPKRIISLVPSQTELLYDLGLEERIIGITKFCVHPYHLKQTKKVIGGTKKVHYEKIKLLQPDIIIANKEENTLEMVEELRKIAPVWVTNVITIEDNSQMIADFGKLFNCRTEAQKWNDKIENAYKEFSLYRESLSTRKVAYFIWRDPFMVAGSDNFINEMLKLNNFQNIYDNPEKFPGRYPEIIIQKIRIQGNPEIVFLSSEPYPFKDEHAFEIGRFTHHAKTIFVDGEMFSWYGSRILKAFEYFKKLHERIKSFD